MSGQPQPSPAAVAGLAGVIDEIRRQEAAGKSWRLSAQDILQLLGLNQVTFYRRIYTAEIKKNPLVSLSAATGVFSQVSIWEFVAVLELFCGPETISALERAGIFFSHTEQSEIMSVFLASAVETVNRHQFQKETFTAMLHTFNSFIQAREVYLEEFFSLNEIRQRAVSRYCTLKDFGISDLALANVDALIQFFFQKRILNTESIFAPLQKLFYTTAVNEGYAEPPRQEQQSEYGSSRSPAEDARKTMGLEQSTMTRKQLKTKYKQLIKLYHPDINPDGLTRCQEINAAYATLIAVDR